MSTDLSATPLSIPVLRRSKSSLLVGRNAVIRELKNDFVQTTREGFRVAHDVSVYSLIALTRGNVAAAVEKIGKAIALNPGEGVYYFNLGLALKQRGAQFLFKLQDLPIHRGRCDMQAFRGATN